MQAGQGPPPWGENKKKKIPQTNKKIFKFEKTAKGGDGWLFLELIQVWDLSNK